jgi:hypothetical protein
MTTPAFEAYLEAMAQHQHVTVAMEVDLLTFTMLVASVQLALRHPAYPPSLRERIEPWLTEKLARLHALSPDIAAALEAGMDAANDLPTL